jgi:hypothetical protein
VKPSVRAIILLGVLTIAFYWKLTASNQFTFLTSPDLAYQVLPWYQFQARAWQSGTFPLWDPHQWCGQPLLGQLQPGATFPLNWPLFWAPLRGGRLNLDLFHWHFVLMHLLAALFMYAYCRELSRSRFASVLAGAGFSFGGYVGTTTWPQMMNGALWTPLVFLYYRRAGRAATPGATAANTAGCGAALGLALLAGHHQIPLFLGAALAGMFAYKLLVNEDRLRQTLVFSGVALVAILAGALAWLPAWEYGSRAYRWLNLPSPLRMNETVPYTALQDLGVIPLSLLGLVAPVDQVTTNPFIGVVAMSLALFGVAAAWVQPEVRLHACLALAGLAYALGSYSVFQGVSYAVIPFLDKARSPGHALLLFHFGLLVAAAYGADSLEMRTIWRSRLIQVLLRTAGLLGAGLLLLAARGAALPAPARSLMLAAAVALLLAALLHGSLRPRVLHASIVGLLLIETSAATAYLLQPRKDDVNPTYLDRFHEHSEAIQFLHTQSGPFRFHADDSEIPYNLGDWEGLDATAGYLASVSADLYDFAGLEWTRTALLLNQVYVLARERTRPEQVEVFSDPGGLKVFRNPDALPRAWVVHEVRSVQNRVEAAALLQDPLFEPARSVFLPASEAPPSLESCEGGSVEITSAGLHRVAARVRTPCRAMAVFSEPIFPGWKALVDGDSARIYAAYGALRGVVVPAGEHHVELLYRPWPVHVGAGLTAAGLGGWLGLVLAARRGSRKWTGRGGPE